MIFHGETVKPLKNDKIYSKYFVTCISSNKNKIILVVTEFKIECKQLKEVRVLWNVWAK